MKFKSILCVVTALASIVAAAAFDEPGRIAVRKAVSAAGEKFKSATALDKKAITILPVKGDAEGYCERLLIGALVDAGKTCVVSNDEKNDERFKRVLAEIKWDEMQTTLKSIDPSTADELGHLKSTQILMEARVDVSRRGRKGRSVAELNLLAYEVKTKKYLWTANIALDDSGSAWPDPSEYNVKVVASPAGEDAAGLAALVGGAVRNEVAKFGYCVNGEGAADLELSVSFAQQVFDRSGSYVVLKGLAHARLVSKSAEGVLYEKTLEAKGKRGLGDAEAVKNLADGLSSEVKNWLGDTLEPRIFFSKHRDFGAAAR